MNEALRALVGCPFCGPGGVRVLWWSRTGVRFEHPACGLRFTLSRDLVTARLATVSAPLTRQDATDAR